jgi:hypothetical protein
MKDIAESINLNDELTRGSQRHGDGESDPK